MGIGEAHRHTAGDEPQNELPVGERPHGLAQGLVGSSRLPDVGSGRRRRVRWVAIRRQALFPRRVADQRPGGGDDHNQNHRADDPDRGLPIGAREHQRRDRNNGELGEKRASPGQRHCRSAPPNEPGSHDAGGRRAGEHRRAEPAEGAVGQVDRGKVASNRQ